MKKSSSRWVKGIAVFLAVMLLGVAAPKEARAWWFSLWGATFGYDLQVFKCATKDANGNCTAFAPAVGAEVIAVPQTSTLRLASASAVMVQNSSLAQFSWQYMLFHGGEPCLFIVVYKSNFSPFPLIQQKTININQTVGAYRPPAIYLL